jgi:hypothetical protein
MPTGHSPGIALSFLQSVAEHGGGRTVGVLRMTRG